MAGRSAALAADPGVRPTDRSATGRMSGFSGPLVGIVALGVLGCATNRPPETASPQGADLRASQVAADGCGGRVCLTQQCSIGAAETSVTPPRLLGRNQTPQQCEEPRSALGDGVVRLEIVVDATGRVTRAQVARSCRACDEACIHGVYVRALLPAQSSGRATVGDATLLCRAERASGRTSGCRS